ncbi:UNVERIFIED_CONTAM: Ubiquitin domain-containing protein 1 [Sesamum angustifolium]|uniref:Ubiquitin domain-containing protein 1 n=1 Tax=Sesamum angustifolium TaxID=2727405 RepID=A0AAW2KU83_9LAMI
MQVIKIGNFKEDTETQGLEAFRANNKGTVMQMREEFWDTAPHYGGRKEIWDALRAAAEADLSLAQAIVDSAGVIVQNPDLTVCYDERGWHLILLP